jgi:hypothetical protein
LVWVELTTTVLLLPTVTTFSELPIAVAVPVVVPALEVVDA